MQRMNGVRLVGWCWAVLHLAMHHVLKRTQSELRNDIAFVNVHKSQLRKDRCCQLFPVGPFYLLKKLCHISQDTTSLLRNDHRN